MMVDTPFGNKFSYLKVRDELTYRYLGTTLPLHDMLFFEFKLEYFFPTINQGIAVVGQIYAKNNIKIFYV